MRFTNSSLIGVLHSLPALHSPQAPTMANTYGMFGVPDDYVPNTDEAIYEDEVQQHINNAYRVLHTPSWLTPGIGHGGASSAGPYQPTGPGTLPRQQSSHTGTTRIPQPPSEHTDSRSQQMPRGDGSSRAESGGGGSMPPPGGPPRPQQRRQHTQDETHSPQQPNLGAGMQGTAFFIPTGGAGQQPLQLAVHTTININGNPQSPVQPMESATRRDDAAQHGQDEMEVPTVPARLLT